MQCQLALFPFFSRSRSASRIFNFGNFQGFYWRSQMRAGCNDIFIQFVYFLSNSEWNPRSLSVFSQRYVLYPRINSFRWIACKSPYWISILIFFPKPVHIPLRLPRIYRFINYYVAFNTLPTVSLDLYKGVKSGRLFYQLSGKVMI
jgi:hypothetical protein